MSKTTASHGTWQCYSRGCRRDECRDAWALYIRERKHRLGEQQPRSKALVAREIEQSEERLAQLVDADDDAELKVSLSPLGFSILIALQKQRGERRGEVLDKLLRDLGPSLLTDAAA